MPEKLPVVVIVGRPNVGKSTFFNRLIRKRVAVVEDQPGITRDRLYAETEWQGKRFTLVDTGGILFNDEDPLVEQIRVQAQVALEEADLILFLTDVIDGLHPDDQTLANHLRGNKLPLYVVVNKADNSQREKSAGEFYSLGIGEVFALSALHGRGVADLLDIIVEHLPKTKKKDEAEQEEITLAIVGRPNVGKSSLLNAFTGEQRAIVSNIPGTTRDAVDTLLEYRNEKFRLVDTAGLRRRGKIQGTVEYYMADRMVRAVERAECALVLIDGGEGLTDGDKRVAKIAHDSGKAVVWVVNKWDLKEEPDGRPKTMSLIKKDMMKIISDQVPELHYAPVCFTSAKENAGMEPVLDTALDALESYNFRIQTGQLNRLVQDAIFEKPLSRKGRALKIYYCTQVTTRPPTFVLFVNDPELVHFSYLRYIENRIRREFPMFGSPIRLKVRSSHERA
ncbi:MAG: ribosome biogenesis GTPase Der [Fimbriimonadaceae bacterium]|nr:ribosome biogenesis GTPase Der [Fimbriimonadaceae bacterium]